MTDIYLPEGEEPDSPRILGPPRPLKPSFGGQEQEIAAVATRGTPILLEPSADAGPLDTAAVLHVTDLMLLANSTALKVVVQRIDGRGEVQLTISDLGARGAGPGLESALPALSVDVRRRYTEVLDDPMSTGKLRLAALKLWAADCAHDLPRILRDAIT